MKLLAPILARGGIGRVGLSSLVATMSDYALFLGLITLGMAAPAATLIGCVFGAVINFTANRYWAFGDHGRFLPAAVRYLMVSGSSACANATLVAILHSGGGLSAQVSWLIARTLVFMGLTYPLFRGWVFAGGHGASKPVAAMAAGASATGEPWLRRWRWIWGAKDLTASAD